ncbi:OmpA family protein [Alteromonas sediminis]|uniref:OmpA family protein n=1 Tax=Alteromonas sediminis TaxID=2259342 RepID=A0A3N5ZE61_9ALTE|nr:OmpA family protein [Alteromonas sediminis]RPJ68588.1 OmpA family protein [Alteromonas sediminis]
MNKVSLALLSLFTLLLSGCATWPPLGKGGMAEHRLESIDPKWRKKTHIPEDGLRFELELLSRHLDVLILEGAELCFPATVVQAKQIEARAFRELKGGLFHDAANDIQVQRSLLYRLERQLDYVLSHEVCAIPTEQKKDTPGELGSQLDTLLNADNQFAFGSAELNPKYVGRLAEAAKLLSQSPQYHLHITGHTDQVGSSEANEMLAKARADKVARYLMIFGIEESRITQEAAAASQPFAEGTTPEVRLTNRRVTIELIENTNGFLDQGGKYE